jgi:hypothetical protein
MNQKTVHRHLSWDHAANMMPYAARTEPCPQGLLVPDTINKRDQIAVVYDKGNPPPEITIQAISGTVHSVLADGIAVAVVARATGPAPQVDEVLLVERSL